MCYNDACLGSTDKTLELASVHERLADVSMEEEKFETAAEEYQKSLELLGVRTVFRPCI